MRQLQSITHDKVRSTNFAHVNSMCANFADAKMCLCVQSLCANFAAQGAAMLIEVLVSKETSTCKSTEFQSQTQ